MFRLIYQLLPNFLDYFLPKELKGIKSDKVEELRLLTSFGLLYLGVIANNVTQYASFGLHRTAVLNVLSLFVFASALGIIKFWGRYTPAARVMVISGAINVLGGIYLTGASHSPILLWSIAIPFLTSWVLEFSSGLVMGIFTISFILFMFFIDPSELGITLDYVSPQVANTFSMSHHIMATLIFLMFAYLYSRKNDRMMRIVEERTQAIATINQHVKSGILMINSSGLIERGYSHSCVKLFGRPIQGLSLADLLCSDVAGREHFLAACDQVFSDSMPSAISLRMFREFYRVNDTDISLAGDIVRSEDGKVAKILFTLNDASAYLNSVRQQKHQELLLNIMSHRELFRDFVMNFLGTIKIMNFNDTSVRGILHTIKGNASVFGWVKLVDMIHSLESKSHITQEDVKALKSYVETFLAENQRLLAIDWEDSDKFAAHIDEDAITQLIQHPSIAASMPLQEVVKDWVRTSRSKRIFALLGAYEDFVRVLSEDLKKEVQFTISGENVLIDAKTWRVLSQNIPALLRNAIFHGIEGSGERKDKERIGKIDLKVSHADGLLKVSVTDDGRGIDFDFIRSKIGVQGELLAKEELAKYLFYPGFSSLSEANQIAGRGVGISSSFAALKAFGGDLQIESEAHIGSVFTMVLPLKNHS